jgi:acyl-CoA thioesterase
MNTETLFDRGVDVRPEGDGIWSAHADEPWTIYKGPNGGYLTALILHAQIAELGDPARNPRSLAVNFIDRAVEGDLRIEVAIERTGRSFSSTTARMYQGDRLCATSHCAFATQREGESYDEFGAPAVPKPEDLPDIQIPPELLPRFAMNFDYKMALGNLPYTGSPNALLGGWIRPKEQRPIDDLLIACYADAFPPSLFARIDKPVDVPTIDLTVHFLGELPLEPDWVLCRFEAPVGENGILIEDGSMWSRDGTLLARSRQLALFKSPG